MKLIICLDNRNGMLFNRRRLSSDQKVCERIIALTEKSKLWMNNYSAKLFQKLSVDIHVAEDFFCRVEAGEYCFTEDQDPLPYLDRVEELFIFRWNRDYPSDWKLPQEWVEKHFQKQEVTEFEGSSHPVITLEVYRK